MVAQFDAPDRSIGRSETRKFSSSQVIGDALKIAATGRRVLVVQFLKGGLHQGEGGMVNLAQNLDWLRCDVNRLIVPGQLDAAELESIQRLWRSVQQLVRSVEYQLVILEDVVEAVHQGAVAIAELQQLLDTLPASVVVEVPGGFPWQLPQAS
jgi:cob(I)alamin adenosyltransferase